MRHFFWPHLLLVSSVCAAQTSSPAPPSPPAPAQAAAAPSAAAPLRTEFHVRYINGANVYIDGGRSAGLAEGTTLVLKQSFTGKDKVAANAALEPGIIAKLTVVSVASTSAVCEVQAKARDLVEGDVVTLPDSEVQKIVEKDTLGNTRKYPMVIAFSEGDPLDEEVRDTVPRPPLPEVNQFRGRIGFDFSTIQQLGQSASTSTQSGMIFRADYTRILGSYWNLNGFWRGSLQSGGGPTQPTLQNLINRTYLMSLTYSNPQSNWTAGAGRLYLPWASSLETIDGGYVGKKFSGHAVTGLFFGSTPDPTSWSYNPQGKIGGAFFNLHGGSYDSFHYSSTAGAGVNLIGWTINRPFVFTENDYSFKRYFSLYHSMQIDRPTANPGATAVGTGIGQSILTFRVQAHPRVALDLTHTYFRDVPTYDLSLVGTGLLDKYLFQGINGGARIQLPEHITGYLTVGSSSTSSDPKSSLNTLYGVSMAHIWKTGLQVDARYSKFDSVFAAGSYKSISINRDLESWLRMNLQGGRYAYTSSLAAASNSYFVNMMMDANIGARYFLQGDFTTQRGGAMDNNQWTVTLGYRFDNRDSSKRRAANDTHP
jgi:hypothetical protein